MLFPSTRAAQAAPPRMTPGTVHAAGYSTHRAIARNSSAATDPKGDLSLPPRTGRGKHLAKPVPQTTLGGPAQAPAGLSGSAPSRASASRPFGFNLPSPCSACRKVKGTCSTSPQAATCCTLKPIQRRPAARRTGVHGPFDAPRGALWGPRCGACTAGCTFSWSSPPFLSALRVAVRCSAACRRRRSSKPSCQPAPVFIKVAMKPRLLQKLPVLSVTTACTAPKPRRHPGGDAACAATLRGDTEGQTGKEDKHDHENHRQHQHHPHRGAFPRTPRGSPKGRGWR